MVKLGPNHLEAGNVTEKMKNLQEVRMRKSRSVGNEEENKRPRAWIILTFRSLMRHRRCLTILLVVDEGKGRFGKLMDSSSRLAWMEGDFVMSLLNNIGPNSLWYVDFLLLLFFAFSNNFYSPKIVRTMTPRLTSKLSSRNG